MKITNIKFFSPYFNGQRQDRKAVAQLKSDNDYDLNLLNQRRISQAIENLGNVSGEDNVNFLLDVAENLKYRTNIQLDGKKSFNDWQAKLEAAVQSSLEKSDKNVADKFSTRVVDVFSASKPLTSVEKEILSLKNSILSQIDRDSLKDIPNDNIKNVKRNMDYFIVSSEVPTTQKLYIMKRLNHFMSPDYDINPQLKDKKSQALAEMVNDIVVDTPESKIPNIKAVNQNKHGICAVISMCRKMLAYEDKPNYIDMVMSELENTPDLQVYDITKLGTKAKTNIPKTYIDFAYAMERGYRIVDTSAMYWMHVGDTYGAANKSIDMYSAFDKENFDTFNDVHLSSDMEENLVPKQDYFKALLQAETAIKKAKKQILSKKIKSENLYAQKRKNNELIKSLNEQLKAVISEINPEFSQETVNSIRNELMGLERKDNIANYENRAASKYYIAADTDKFKIDKINKLILSYVGNVDDKTKSVIADKSSQIYELITGIKEFSESSEKQSFEAKTISRAETLYNAAAAYRTQQLFQLDVPEYADVMLSVLNIPDKESRILDNIDMLIKKLETNSMKPELRKQLAKNFQTEDNNEALLEGLTETRETVNYILTSMMDDLYASILSVNRKHGLANQLRKINNEILLTKDKSLVSEYADILKTKDNSKSVSKALEKVIAEIDSPEFTDEQYIKMLNKFGYKSQMQMFKDSIENFAQYLFEQKEETIIQGFNAMCGGNPNLPPEKTIELFNKVAENFNNISNMISSYANALNVVDNNTVLNTIQPKYLVMKKLENLGELPARKELEVLNKRFVKIDKERSKNIEGRTKYKDLPKELTTLTPFEVETLNKYEKNINSWMSTITRRVESAYKELEEPLLEHSRKAGLYTGQRYVSVHAHSGLSAPREVKVAEHMTGRPYYIEYDGKVALDKAKNSPYSGISAMSVTTDSYGGHAQYIADIKPVKVKMGDNYVEKDSVFHDNSWGASEHEGMWQDENGLLRTDYESDCGGPEGFITGKDYKNGILAEDLFGLTGEEKAKYIENRRLRKLSRRDYDWKFPLFADIITPGRYPNAMQYVQGIRQLTLLSPYKYLDDIEKYAQSMTKDELKFAMSKVDNLGKSAVDKYFAYINRINNKNIIGKDLKTLQDYNALPDDDDLKLLLQKVAILKSYQNIPDVKLFNKKMTPKTIQAMAEKVKNEARKNFDYTFAKNPDIAKYGVESVRADIYKKLDQFAQENNLKKQLSKNVIDEILRAMKNIDINKFDGSLNNTIDLIGDEFKESLNAKTSKFAHKDEKITVLANEIKDILKTNMGFTLADLNNPSFETGSLKNIEKWIEDIFNPASDEEFVQIFNNLQNMTAKEFNSLYGSKITNEALGIKSVTGFDILTQIRANNEKTLDSFFNAIYNQETLKDIEYSKTTPSYDYNKFERVMNGATYVKGKRSFDDIYTDFYFSLLSLTLKKRYRKENFEDFKHYGVLPAYPKVDYEDLDFQYSLINDTFNGFLDDIRAVKAFKNQKRSFEILRDTQNILNDLDNNKSFPDKKYEMVINNLTEFMHINDGDETIVEVLNSINDVLNNSKDVADFKNIVNTSLKTLLPFEKTPSGMTMDDSAKEALKSIDRSKRELIMNSIEPKYQDKAFELINKWIAVSMKIQDNPDDYVKTAKAEALYSKFIDLYMKHSITKNPEKILNEFLLMSAKDAKPNDPDASGENAVESMKELMAVKKTYKGALSGLLYSANVIDIQQLLMNCAKKGNLNIVGEEFSKSKMELTNGAVIPLDSDFALNSILYSMLADNNIETAVMFIDQLGLSEKVIKMLTYNDKVEKLVYKDIKRISTILKNVDAQCRIIREETENIKEYENVSDFFAELEDVKAKYEKRVKNTRYKMTANFFTKAIENTIEELTQKPELPQAALLQKNIETAKTAAIYVAKQDIEKINNRLSTFDVAHDLIMGLSVAEGSPAAKMKEEYLERSNKVQEFRESLSQHFEEIDLSI